MNQDLRFDRSYLRRQVWPLIEARWPGCAVALVARGAPRRGGATAVGWRGRGSREPAARRRRLVGAGPARAPGGGAHQRRALLAERGRRRAAVHGTLDRGAAANVRRAGRSLAGHRVGRSCAAPLSATTVSHAMRSRRGWRGRAAGGPRAARASIWAEFGRAALGRAGRRSGRCATAGRAQVRRRDGGESLRPAPQPEPRPCSTCASRTACCPGCAMRCRWCSPAMSCSPSRICGWMRAGACRNISRDSRIRWTEAPIVD